LYVEEEEEEAGGGVMDDVLGGGMVLRAMTRRDHEQFWSVTLRVDGTKEVIT
jgi:hypothetical protein